MTDDAQIDTDPIRRPMGLRCRACDTALDESSAFDAAGRHRCGESQGNTPDSASPATLTDRR